MIQDNALDKDFQTMLLPLNLLEYIYCQPRFQISRAIVRPNGTLGKLHLIMGVVFIILGNIGNIFITKFIPEYAKNVAILKLIKTDAVFYSVSGILVCGTHLVQADKTVQLLIRIQKAFRVLHDARGLKSFKRGNWIFVVSIFLSYLLYNLSYTLFHIFNMTHCIHNIMLFYFDVNVVVAVRMVKFLVYELQLWRKNLDQFLKTCSKTNHEQLVKYLVDAGDQEKRLFSAYTYIVEAFKLFPGVFGMPILVIVVEAFLHPLVYVQFVIDVSKNTTEETQVLLKMSLLVSLIWIMKTFTLLGCLCVSCQQFYLAVADVDASCAVIAGNDGCLVYVHRLSKNVLRCNECLGAREAMRAGNLVSIAASTPLHLLILLGTYTVVLLQFAFL